MIFIMIERKILRDLNEWKKRTNCKPLILRGARQVGKTTVVNQFSNDFNQYIYLNLEIKTDREVFENNYSFDKLLQAIFFIKNADISEKSTLIFIDDTGKYAAGSTTFQIIRHTIESAPAETGKRIRFQEFGNSNYLSREMGEALRTLERAMLLYLIYPVTEYTPPSLPNLKNLPDFSLEIQD